MAEASHSLRYIAQDSALHRMYPLTKLIWVLVVAVGLFIYHTPISGLIIFISVFLLAIFAGGIRLKDIFGSAQIIFGLGLILLFFHLVSQPGHLVYTLGPVRITDNGLRLGPVYFFRLSAVVLASFVLIWTTDSRDLMVSLARAGIPYRYAFAVFLAMRFLPLMQREVDAVHAAHAIRGNASRTGLGHRVKLWQRYIFTILINGLRKAETTATALECRAFGLYPDRTYTKELPESRWGIVLVGVFTVLTAALIILEHI